ncbi:hypothetical protein FB558_8134 [Pseudonocardia kunmingensis]|uniref:Uncharacterized protein n=1 Tax=Pseudonocardia kunmingensis TaxID=630975 RepID=A0A543CZE1_9PSEU|nr:hypothetical protein FB558_8134 [Pseudonocardia kunmingensis]
MSGTRLGRSRRGPAGARSGTAAGVTTSLGSSANRATLDTGDGCGAGRTASDGWTWGGATGPEPGTARPRNALPVGDPRGGAGRVPTHPRRTRIRRRHPVDGVCGPANRFAERPRHDPVDLRGHRISERAASRPVIGPTRTRLSRPSRRRTSRIDQPALIAVSSTGWWRIPLSRAAGIDHRPGVRRGNTAPPRPTSSAVWRSRTSRPPGSPVAVPTFPPPSPARSGCTAPHGTSRTTTTARRSCVGGSTRGAAGGIGATRTQASAAARGSRSRWRLRTVAVPGTIRRDGVRSGAARAACRPRSSRNRDCA